VAVIINGNATNIQAYFRGDEGLKYFFVAG